MVGLWRESILWLGLGWRDGCMWSVDRIVLIRLYKFSMHFLSLFIFMSLDPQQVTSK